MLGKHIGSRFASYKNNLQDIVQNHQTVDNRSRLRLIMQKCKLSVTNPEDGTHISNLSDLTSFSALTDIRQRMLADPVGHLILHQKPRITNSVIDSLKDYGPGTFGKEYHNFLYSNGFQPQQRPLVKYVPDVELAYVLQRYKEIHDFLHVLLLKETSVQDQLIVKWFQMVQLKLPSASLSAMVTPFMLGPLGMWRAFRKQIPEAVEKGNKCKFVMNVYFQKHFAQDLGDFKRELGL